MSENKFQVFAENVSSTDTLTDENYRIDTTRIGGNTVGIARRAPNNKALKQATLAATALGDYIAARTDTDVTDEMGHAALGDALAQAVQSDADKQIEASNLFVRLDGEQTVNGVKSFIDLPVSEKLPVADNQLINKLHFDTEAAKLKSDSQTYTDNAIADLDQTQKDYIDKVVSDALEEAKDYTDTEIAEGGGGGGGTGGAVLAPEIVSPENGSVGFAVNGTLQGGPFRSSYSEQGNVRTERQFQVTRSNWSNCDIDVKVNADSYEITDFLVANEDYKWRCRDFSSFDITSPWSEEAAFMTGGELQVNAPSVVSITGGQDTTVEAPTIVMSAFEVNQGEDTHQCTDWYIRTSGGTEVWKSLNDATNLTTITVPKGLLTVSTGYTLQVRYRGVSYGWSAFVTYQFTTAAQFDHVQTPTVEVQGGTTAVYDAPTFVGSAFTPVSDVGTPDTHEMTDWVVKNGSLTVWQSRNDTTNKTTITMPRGLLSESTQYTVQVRYKGTNFGWSEFGSINFTTVAVFAHIATPTLTCSDGTTEVMETPTITGSAFTVEPAGQPSDTHTWTTWDVLQNGTTSVYKLNQSTTALTTLNIPSGVLTVGQQYTVTCVYNGATYGPSASGSLSFTTANAFVGPRPPVLTITPSAEAFLATGSIKAAGEYVNGDYEADKAEWELLPAAGGAALWQSGEVTGAKIELCWAPFGDAKLAASTTYKIRCRQHYSDNEQGGTWSNWAEKNFTTSADYAKVPEWGRIYFKVGSGSGDLKTSYFRWYDADVIHITVNGEENPSTTITLNEGDVVSIYNSERNSTPDLWFKPLNPVEILEPLPLLTLDAAGEQPVTDFGGDVGVERTNSNRNTSTDKYGLFAQCSNLTTLCDGLFRNNPQVYCFGAMGGGGGGGGGGALYSKSDGGWGGNGGGGAAGGQFGKNNFPSPQGNAIDGKKGSNGRNGYGCFSSTKISRVPDDLFSYLDKKNNTYNRLMLGGYGGGNGGKGGLGGGTNLGGNGGKGGSGGDGYSVFYNCSEITELPEKLFQNLPSFMKVDVFGGNSDRGGSGYSAFYGTKIAQIPSSLFKNVNLEHFSSAGSGQSGRWGGGGIGGGSDGEGGLNGGGGGGGYYGGGGGGGGGTATANLEKGIAGGRGGSGGAMGGSGTNGRVNYVDSAVGNGGGGGGGGGIYGGGSGGGGTAYDPNPSSQIDYSSQHGAFEGCAELTSVPQDLLADIDIESLPNTFKGCTKLQYADIRLRCERIMSVQGFSDGTPTKTIVRVKTGSNTATSFNSQSTNTTVILEA